MRLAFLCAAAAGLYGQTFEVASVKVAPPPEGGGMRVGTSGGPGSKDPGRWSCLNMSLSNLISNAFDVPFYQLTGPDWMNQQRFNIEAKVPQGATRDDLKKMIENLLLERFGLQYHREPKDMTGFELVVAKGGPKLKETGPPPEGGAPEWSLKLGPNGFPEIPVGSSGMAVMNGKAAKRGTAETMELLARNLAGQVSKPVTDATGLKGKYDYFLYWMSSGRGPSTAETEDVGPTLFTAIQEQLGLKLESKKVTIQMLVVDKVEKTPTEN
jgi:uncharacterized protein (TIGR03435 family)